MEVGIVRRFYTGGPIVGAQQLSFEWQPNGWMMKAIRSSYGPYRLHLNSHLEFLRNKVPTIEGAVMSLSYIAGPLAPGRRSERSRTVLTYTIYSDLGQLSDFSLFVSYYTGQDYYNLHFDRNISTFKIGALAGVRPLTRVPNEPRPLPAMRE